jgi:UDP-N-acetylmuramate dehydrogenase
VPLFLPQFNLQKYNTLAVPAVADWYVSASNDIELHEALAYAREQKLPILVLGGGSNLVLRDNFYGLVIHIRSQGKDLVNENEDYVWLQVAAGENWHKLVEYSLAQGFYGLENLALIPGSVGAAPIQNIGAYGVELKDVFAELTALDIHSGLVVTFTADSCQFGYRDSIFKQSLKDQYIITSVTFKLRKIAQLVLDYPALRESFADRPIADITPLDVSNAVISIRQSKLPDPAELPNVGSFFKNPIVTSTIYRGLKNTWPELVAYPVDDNHFKLAAGWLIDRAGWRGRVQDGVEVHARQALVLTNPHKQSGNAVLALAATIQTSVQEVFGVWLEMEPRVYPD